MYELALKIYISRKDIYVWSLGHEKMTAVSTSNKKIDFVEL